MSNFSAIGMLRAEQTRRGAPIRGKPRYCACFAMLAVGMKSHVKGLPEPGRSPRLKLRCVNRVQSNQTVNRF